MLKKVALILIILMSSCDQKTKVIFLGDSITELADSSGLEGTYRGFLAIMRERMPSSFDFINKGVSGDKIADLLLRYESDVLLLEPDIVFIYIGINDVWHKYQIGSGSDIDIYEKGLRKIVSNIKKMGIRIVLCTPTVIGEDFTNWKEKIVEAPPSTPFLMNQDLDFFSEVVARVSKDYQVEIIDLRQLFKDYLIRDNKGNQYKGILTYDGVHLNTKGNQLLADEFMKILAP